MSVSSCSISLSLADIFNNKYTRRWYLLSGVLILTYLWRSHSWWSKRERADKESFSRVLEWFLLLHASRCVSKSSTTRIHGVQDWIYTLLVFHPLVYPFFWTHVSSIKEQSPKTIGVDLLSLICSDVKNGTFSWEFLGTSVVESMQLESDSYQFPLKVLEIDILVWKYCIHGISIIYDIGKWHVCVGLYRPRVQI